MNGFKVFYFGFFVSTAMLAGCNLMVGGYGTDNHTSETDGTDDTADTDGDVDGDTDTDTDGDTDTDADGDTDTDVDGDTDTDTDTDVDGDTDTDVDGDTDTDVDGDTDTDADGDTDTDVDGDTDTDVDGDTDTDVDGDTDTDADSDTDAVVIGEDWTSLPPGEFWMGSPDGACPADYPGGTGCTAELGRSAGEVLHYVKLTSRFEISRTEVTQAQFEEAMGWSPTYFTSCGAACPVENVSFLDALAYANQLSLSEGLAPCYAMAAVKCVSTGNTEHADYTICETSEMGGISWATVTLSAPSVYECEGYRLPTEAEWEYAVRAGSYTAFYPSDGNDGSIIADGYDVSDPNMNQIGWYTVNSSGTTHSVAELESNAWGLYDMLGNAHEWTWDPNGNYTASDMDNPSVNPVNPGSGSYRILRGGDFNAGASSSRSAVRLGSYAMGSRDRTRGFRLVRTFL